MFRVAPFSTAASSSGVSAAKVISGTAASILRNVFSIFRREKYFPFLLSKTLVPYCVNTSLIVKGLRTVFASSCLYCATSAAAPATIGAEKLVPEYCPKFLPAVSSETPLFLLAQDDELFPLIDVVQIPTPGASRSNAPFALLKLGTVSGTLLPLS